MHDCVGKRIAQLPFATPHQNSVLQCILGHLAKFIQVLIEYLDFSVQAMTLPEESCQRTDPDELIIEFTLSNVGLVPAKPGAGTPCCRGVCLPILDG